MEAQRRMIVRAENTRGAAEAWLKDPKSKLGVRFARAWAHAPRKHDPLTPESAKAFVAGVDQQIRVLRGSFNPVVKETSSEWKGNYGANTFYYGGRTAAFIGGDTLRLGPDGKFVHDSIVVADISHEAFNQHNPDGAADSIREHTAHPMSDFGADYIEDQFK